jgi:hypothetical protein
VCVSSPVRAGPRASPIPATIRVAAAVIPGVAVTDRVVAAATSAAHAIGTIAARGPLQPTGHRGRTAPTDRTAALPAPVPSEATGAIAPVEANVGIDPIARAVGIAWAAPKGIAWVAPIEIARRAPNGIVIGTAPSGRSNRVRRR